MLLLASPWAASADDVRAADDNLALPDQPTDNGTLVNQSGSVAPVNILDTNNNIVQQQPNTITIIPSAMNTAITKSGSIDIGNDSSSASITSSASATLIRTPQTP
jgi:hypothetical protein